MNVDVRLQRLSEAKEGGCFPELQGKETKELSVAGCSILEGGCGSGRPAVMFHAVEGDKLVVFQFTAAMFESIAGILRGAEQRWKEHPNG